MCEEHVTCYDVFYSHTKVNYYSKKDETLAILCWFPTMWHLFIFVYDRFKAIHNKLYFIKSLIRNYILIFTTFIHFSRHNYNITLLFFCDTDPICISILCALIFFMDYKLLLNLFVFSSYNSTELNIDNVFKDEVSYTFL